MTKDNSTNTKAKSTSFQANTNEAFKTKIYAMAKINQTNVTHIINELLFEWHLTQLEIIKRHPELQMEYEDELLKIKNESK